ncbi:TylF/MycF/NovP-related O-methyltransferase [Brevibacillus marinus]|uniref:TylF/MycF/NovP-related O-methyltransferase n=1 Tax=Brevibacillus marinus TaxID=2496837 RepID=UPI000F84409B|nr:TylF/MycF/NovP-related O-methyltransferase [Brevibacillus marinus]
MTLDKKSVILFGAGDGGLSASYHLVQQFEIIAFVDNDPRKHGKELLSKPIIPPAELKNYEYDFIIISSIHGDSIYKQLTQELHVSPDKIIDYYKGLIFDTRVAALRQVADEIYDHHIPGSVAELGVYKGDFAKYINQIFYDRKLFLFDTFSGFDERDAQFDQKHKYSDSEIGDFCNTNIDLVLDKMTYKENCIIKKGYFPDTAHDVDDQFCFVSIDVDLYIPIYEGLKFFYPKMVEGGYIFVHDYNSTRFKGVKEAVRTFCKENNAKYFPISDLSGSVVIMR